MKTHIWFSPMGLRVMSSNILVLFTATLNINVYNVSKLHWSSHDFEHGSNEIHLSTSERSHNVKRYTVYFIDQVNLNQQLKLEVKPCKKKTLK